MLALCAAWVALSQETNMRLSAKVQGSTAPSQLVPKMLDSTLPEDPDFDETGEEEKDRPFFNAFSWKMFIALSWPADEIKRGDAHPTKKFGDTSVPVVWAQWKSLEELFPDDPKMNPPGPWESFEATLMARKYADDKKWDLVPLEGLPIKGAGKVKVLGPVSHFSAINQAGIHPSFPKGALIAQNKTYVRYEARVNMVSYNFIRDKGFYLREHLDKVTVPIEFPEHSITVKAAWVELPDDKGIRDRFFNVQAKLVNRKEDGTPFLVDKRVGLVGLHIVRKTKKRPNWIWSTFEHVDNIERSPTGGAPTFNDQDTPRMHDKNTNVQPTAIDKSKPLPEQSPVLVARRTPLEKTVSMKVNDDFRDHPQIKDTVWRNYQLVGTQWPPQKGGQERLPDKVDNVTMETYTQPFGCMNCHLVADKTPFVFYPKMRTYPAK